MAAMTGPPVPRIDVRSISLGGNLGTGGQGSVTKVNHFRVGGQWDAVLKTYSPATVTAMRPDVLEKVIGFPRLLSSVDRRWLDEHTAWPAVIAEDEGAVCGFLMREVPPSYYFDFRTRTQGAQRKLADLAFLLNPDDYVVGSGLEVNEKDRVALLLVIAKTLSRLHALGVVVGDLSPKNILFSPGHSPDCFIIDCDTVQLRGEAVLEQVDTSDWEAPGNEPKGTVTTDSYKFGLLAIRLFARDQSSRDVSALKTFSADLGRLAEFSLHGDPARRPSPGEWIPALTATDCSPPVLPHLVSPPVVTPAQVSVPVPPLVVSAGTVSSGVQTVAAIDPDGPVRRPPRRTATAFIGLALLIIAVTAAIVAVVVTHSPSQVSASATSKTSGDTRPSSPVQQTAGPASPSWQPFQEAGLFSISLPAGWAVSSQSRTEINFTGQPPGFDVVVAWTRHPRADQYTDWLQQAAAKAQADPTYRQISIQSVSYRGYNAADWEFTNVYQGVRTHVMDRGFIVTPGHLAYAIELYGPADDWPTVFTSMWSKLVTSFQSAG
jgi:hypothetical protein